MAVVRAWKNTCVIGSRRRDRPFLTLALSATTPGADRLIIRQHARVLPPLPRTSGRHASPSVTAPSRKRASRLRRLAAWRNEGPPWTSRDGALVKACGTLGQDLFGRSDQQRVPRQKSPAELRSATVRGRARVISRGLASPRWCQDAEVGMTSDARLRRPVGGSVEPPRHRAGLAHFTMKWNSSHPLAVMGARPS